MYLTGINEASGSRFDAFCFIAVSKDPPYQVEVYMLDDEFVDYGRSEYRRLLALELECRKRQEYPNYQNPGIVTLYKPGYL
jgi:exodeoxyribonuclease VIII